MVDRTVYAQGPKPSQAVSQIFARAKVPADVCIRFATADLRTVEMISVLGESPEKVPDSLSPGSVVETRPLGLMIKNGRRPCSGHVLRGRFQAS